MSVRVGPDTIERLDEYTRRYHLKKVDFVRDAVNYWISVGGKAANLNEKIRRLESKLNQSREINKRLRERMYDKINYLNSIISEKEKLISVQEELLSHYKKK
ncbi:MAG: DUF1216 domain-containing protein [Methanocorpusculum sp.]|nr:DUF1216 domain-containing protein [Methanocorpusculum sp.]